MASWLKEAAVIIPVYREGTDIKIVLVLRSDVGIHGGQMAFPGGKCEPGDPSLWATALRETKEEIGLDDQHIELIAELPAVKTRTTGYLIHPFLARIQPPDTWRLESPEINRIIAISVSELLKPEASGERTMDFPTWKFSQIVPFYRVGEYIIWGVTYRILKPLIPLLLAEKWKI